MKVAFTIEYVKAQKLRERAQRVNQNWFNIIKNIKMIVNQKCVVSESPGRGAEIHYLFDVNFVISRMYIDGVDILTINWLKNTVEFTIHLDKEDSFYDNLDFRLENPGVNSNVIEDVENFLDRILHYAPG